MTGNSPDNRSGDGSAATDRLARGAKHHAPATDRNKAPILNVLKRVLPVRGCVLEIASGTGQHAVAFAEAFPDVQWQPSDPDPGARGSIRAWMDEAGHANIRAPLPLDAAAPGWHEVPDGPVDAILAINLIHISPWSATTGLMRGAGVLLSPGGLLFLYGPFKRDGEHTAPSNAEFDGWLRERNSDWGVRDVTEVEAEANARGLDLIETVEMPANNLSLVFRKV